ncbi:hypothetical protein DKX38_022324 [Salix brachista]|uniref:Retrotransposon Copia-like N-terminal domain-containing protein n=1 Tax=Salix brachista TaxID=2182728 RepID=A0A5N5K501_9ROSI|nr:hypothetical protein DKX38_022324 [Salix brachista]
MSEENSSSVVKSSSSKSVYENDSSSPYFFNSSDNPGGVLVSCLLKGDNYPTWRRAMMNALRAKNKLGFVDGSLLKPKEDIKEIQTWEKCNSMVISWIFNALAPELHDSVAYVDSAHEMWGELQERFSQGNVPRIHELKREICLAQQKDLTVSVYYTKLKGLWDELAAYSTVPLCSCGAGKQIWAERETEKVHQFLMGLNDQYGIIRSQILNMEPFPSINKAYAFVTKEEKQLAIAGISRDQLTEAAGFNVKHNRFPTKNFAGEQQRGETSKFPTKDFAADQQRGETSRFRCSYCDKPGHSKEKCFKLVGYPSSWQNKAKTPNFARQNRNFRREPEHVSSNNAIAESSQSTGKSFNLTQEQYEQLMFLLPSASQNVANFVGKVTHSTGTTDWILDSGASEHLTCDSLDETDTQTTLQNLPVKLPNGTSVPVHSVGQIRLLNMALDHVLYIPSFKCNLLSISKAQPKNTSFPYTR